MIEKIAKILAIKKDVLNIYDLKEIVKIVIEYERLEESLTNGIVFISKEEAKKKFEFSDLAIDFWRGGYYSLDKAIYMQLDNVYVFCKGSTNNKKLDREEQITITNLLILFILLHELEHANQENKKYGTYLEAQILFECATKENDDTYAISPKERFANIYALLQILEIANMLGLSEKIINYFKKDLQYKIIFPYIWLIKRNVGPTNEYFKAHNNYAMFEKLNELSKDNPNLDFRILFGLPISKLEFDENKWRIFDWDDYKKILVSCNCDLRQK